jgi:hypothetical protein
MFKNILKSEFCRRLFRGILGGASSDRCIISPLLDHSRFGAGLIVGKLLTLKLKDPKTWKAVAGLPTLNP